MRGTLNCRLCAPALWLLIVAPILSGCSSPVAGRCPEPPVIPKALMEPAKNKWLTKDPASSQMDSSRTALKTP